MNTQKDPMFLFRSTMVGKNSKGGDRLQLYMDQEQVVGLIEHLTTLLGNDRGVKLDIHTSDKVKDGRSFKSSFAFIKAVAEAPVGGPGRFAPKRTAQDLDAKIAELKAGKAKQVA